MKATTTSSCPLLLLFLLVLLFAPEAAPTPQRRRGTRRQLNALKRIFNEVIAEANNRGEQALTCPKECPDSFRPVCGSDSRVYRNECALRRTACRNTAVRKVNDGPCVHRPPGAGERVPEAPSSSPCKEECTRIILPVCGTDSKTYNNKCILESETCLKRQQDPSYPQVTVAHDGACEKHRCQESCPDSYRPVCGTNDLTYHNKCELKVASCLKGTVRQRYEGVCALSSSSSSGHRQSEGLRPSLDLAKAPATPQEVPASEVEVRRRCNNQCTQGFRPVCGADGITYGSNCLFSCVSPGVLKSADGVCPKDCSLVCNEDNQPLCGTDGITYKNVCFLVVANCKDKSIKEASRGPCAETPRRRACGLRCTNELNPVCGSDGATYDNACWLEYATCTFQGLLKLYDGRCTA